MEEKLKSIDAVMDMLLTLSEALDYCDKLYDRKNEKIFNQVLGDFFDGVENVQKVSGTIINEKLSNEFISINSDINELINKLKVEHEYNDLKKLVELFPEWQKALLVSFKMGLSNN